jgi:hypothetical protein
MARLERLRRRCIAGRILRYLKRRITTERFDVSWEGIDRRQRLLERAYRLRNWQTKELRGWLKPSCKQQEG